jgi:hypothetical protein
MSDIQVAPVPVLDETLPDSRQRSTLSDILGPVIVFVFFIGIWYLLSTVILPEQKRFLLPTPHKVIAEGFGVWRSGERRGLQPILLSVWDTAKIALIVAVPGRSPKRPSACPDSSHPCTHRQHTDTATSRCRFDCSISDCQQHIVRIAVSRQEPTRDFHSSRSESVGTTH